MDRRRRRTRALPGAILYDLDGTLHRTSNVERRTTNDDGATVGAPL
jgi:hypothetical protein